MANKEPSSRFSFDLMLGQEGFAADHASVADDTVVVSTHGPEGSQLHTFTKTGARIIRGNSWNVEGEVTCVSLFTASNNAFVIAGSVLDGVSRISAYSTDGILAASEALVRHTGQALCFHTLSCLTIVLFPDTCNP